MIYGLTVGKNEANRYLFDSLKNNSGYFDRHLFYDDQSLDATPMIVRRCRCDYVRRGHSEASFLEDEGLFRWQAWNYMVDIFNPKIGDWIFVVDCDEFIVGDLYPMLYEVAPHMTAVMIDIPEVFGFDTDGVPLVRVDRLWGTIHGARLVRWCPEAQFVTGHLGVPPVPTYAMAQHLWWTQEMVKILHYGYARERDRLDKYGRYAGRQGHSNAHVESILARDMQLIRWEGECPDIRPSE
jgi:hypothetical protein